MMLETHQQMIIYKDKGFADHTRQLSWQMQVQSTKYPEFEAQSLSETFYYLRQAIHYMNPEQESLSFLISSVS